MIVSENSLCLNIFIVSSLGGGVKTGIDLYVVSVLLRGKDLLLKDMPMLFETFKWIGLEADKICYMS